MAKKEMTEKKFYVAYGSNLNKAQMRYRCPDAKAILSGYLKDFELFYAGSMTGNYATIRQKKGAVTPIGVWEISKSDERNLDRYEGYPVFYTKKILKLKYNGEEIKAIVYIMREDAIEGMPTDYYVRVVRQGYRDFGLKEKYLNESLLKTYEAAV